MLIVTSKSAHTKLLQFITSPSTSQKSLANSLQLDNVDWRKIYVPPRQTTIESSLRSFQYKILIDTLYLNDRGCLSSVLLRVIYVPNVRRKRNQSWLSGLDIEALATPGYRGKWVYHPFTRHALLV